VAAARGHPGGQDIYVAMRAIQVFGVRLAYLLSATPLFVLVYGLATVDGLTERYIRRACAGRESSDAWKLGRLANLGAFALVGSAYLILPVTMRPVLIVLPLALVLAVATRYQWAYYKKYF
jgi:integrating conjugative element membrane protein (TIGR03747 family)